jgi:hypothetical protein
VLDDFSAEAPDEIVGNVHKRRLNLSLCDIEIFGVNLQAKFKTRERAGEISGPF